MFESAVVGRHIDQPSFDLASSAEIPRNGKLNQSSGSADLVIRQTFVVVQLAAIAVVLVEQVLHADRCDPLVFLPLFLEGKVERPVRSDLAVAGV